MSLSPSTKGQIRFGLRLPNSGPLATAESVIQATRRSGGNYAQAVGYSNQEVDKLLDDAAAIYDTAIAGPMYIEAQKIVFEDIPYITLYNDTLYAGLNVKVQNYR